MTLSRKSRVVGAVLLAGSLIVSACAGATSSTDSSQDQATEEALAVEQLLVGDFETLAGTTVNLSELEGQDIVFWFWAPW